MSHARLMPSALEQTLQCHASVQLQEQHGLPEDQSSAEEGTAAHEVMAEVLEGVIVEPGAKAANGVTITEAMVDGAELLRDDIIERLGPNWRDEIVIEQPLAPGIFGPDFWGTPDVRAPRQRIIWDYKFGYAEHEPFMHPQLLGYAALSDPSLSERFELVIVQPRAFHRDGPVRPWTTKLDQHPQFWSDVRIALAQAVTPEARFRVGPACRNCSARHACPEIKRGTSVDREWSRLTFQFDPAIIMPPGAVSYELSEIDDAIKLLTARKTGLEEQAKQMIRSGQQVPAWEIGYGRGRQEWVQPVTQVINMGELFGVDLRKPPRVITPKQALSSGMDPDMVRAASKHTPGEARLQRNNGERARRAFGGE